MERNYDLVKTTEHSHFDGVEDYMCDHCRADGYTDFHCGVCPLNDLRVAEYNRKYGRSS